MARRKAHRQTRPTQVNRASPGRFWIYGLHAVRAALLNPERRRLRLMATPEGMSALETRLSGQNADWREHAGAVLSEIATRETIEAVLPVGAVHQGLALQVEPLPAADMEQVLAAAAQRKRAVAVVLDRVADPQNLGAVLRAAAAFGALCVIVPDRHAPGESGAVAKSASGALEILPLLRVGNVGRALERLKRAGFWCAGLDPVADQVLGAAAFDGKTALVLGTEGAGLRRLTRERCDFLFRIPVAEAVGSLNLASATAVALWEVTRQG